MKKTEPLMPRATAVWLIDNTSLTFHQIATFCNLHILRVEAIADGDAEVHTQGFDPVVAGQTTAESIAECEKDPQKQLVFLEDKDLKRKTSGSRYTSSKKRQVKPDGIAWLVRTYPDITTAQVVRLLGTTASTVEAIRSGTHSRLKELNPQNPVALGLVTEEILSEALALSRKRAKNKADKEEVASKKT